MKPAPASLTPREEQLAAMVNANLERRRSEERTALFQGFGPLLSYRILWAVFGGILLLQFILGGHMGRGLSTGLWAFAFVAVIVFYEFRCYFLRRDVKGLRERVEILQLTQGAGNPPKSSPASDIPVYHASPRLKR